MLRIGNDLGMNFKVTDAFSIRVSYLTEDNDSGAIRSDNKLGISLVYGFRSDQGPNAEKGTVRCPLFAVPTAVWLQRWRARSGRDGVNFPRA